MVLRLRQHNIGYTADGFYRSDDPTNSQSTEEGWLVIQTGLNLTMLTSPCYNTSHPSSSILVSIESPCTTSY